MRGVSGTVLGLARARTAVPHLNARFPGGSSAEQWAMVSWPASSQFESGPSRYAAAMAGGFVALGLAKSIINSIPVVNLVTRPVLGEQIGAW